MENTEDLEFNRVIFYVLSELREEYLANLKSEKGLIIFNLFGQGVYSKNKLDRAIRYLINKDGVGAIKFYSDTHNSSLSEALKTMGAPHVGYYIRIIQPKFDELYNSFLQFKIVDHGSKNTIYKFNLDIYYNRAVFYMDENRRIEFRSLNKPYLIEMLYKAKGKYLKTEDIVELLEEKLTDGKKIEKLSAVVTALRNIIKLKFGIDPRIVIPDGMSGSGYRVGDVEIIIRRL